MADKSGEVRVREILAEIQRQRETNDRDSLRESASRGGLSLESFLNIHNEIRQGMPGHVTAESATAFARAIGVEPDLLVTAAF